MRTSSAPYGLLAGSNAFQPAPDRSDQPFGKAILPRRIRCGRPVPDAHSARSARNDAAIDPVAIADEVARGPHSKKCLRYLTCNPFHLGELVPGRLSSWQYHAYRRGSHHAPARMFCDHSCWEEYFIQRRICQNLVLCKFLYPGLCIMRRWSASPEAPAAPAAVSHCPYRRRF